ncbi:MAG TPA: hypothetical protein VH590_01500, partial [Ktedonobacterales bacterium]
MGDSNEDILLKEDEDREDDPLQVTSQELRRLRAQERQRQLAYNPGGYALPAEEDEHLAKTAPMFPGPQPAAPPLPITPPAPFRGRPISLPPTQLQNAPTGPFRPNAANAASLSGWQSIRRHSHWLIPVLL